VIHGTPYMSLATVCQLPIPSAILYLSTSFSIKSSFINKGKSRNNTNPATTYIASHLFIQLIHYQALELALLPDKMNRAILKFPDEKHQKDI